jgi:hypothetical protein|tara:strand:- start:709 stop:906 length:198 start_codon:yes stop_codon:yes gene_type:complete
MIAKTDNSNYVRDMNSNAILAFDKIILEQHRKRLHESSEINKLKNDIQDLKSNMGIILNILKNKE